MSKGFVKIHRKFTEWEWYDDHNTSRLFLHLLLTVNYKPTKYRGMNVPAGATITGRVRLADETGLSQQNIRTSLTRLKSTSDLTTKKTPHGTIYQLVNWQKYQLLTSDLTTSQPELNQSLTTFKEVKEDKEVYRAFAHLSLSADDYNRQIDKGWTSEQIDNTLDAIYNFKGNTKYKDLNLLLQNWLRREYKAPSKKHQFKLPKNSHHV